MTAAFAVLAPQVMAVIGVGLSYRGLPPVSACWRTSCRAWYRLTSRR
jgi:hypothetical protein